MEYGPGLKMYFLLNMGIFQPAMLVYQGDPGGNLWPSTSQFFHQESPARHANLPEFRPYFSELLTFADVPCPVCYEKNHAPFKVHKDLKKKDKGINPYMNF